jgi:hypothetical protein
VGINGIVETVRGQIVDDKSQTGELVDPRRENPIASLGGKASAAKLTPEERKERARLAAEARWSADLPYATDEGPLHIAGHVILCAVLNDERRVLNQETFLTSIGRARKAKAGTGSTRIEGVDELPPFLAAKNLNQFISEELRRSTKPIPYRTMSGGRAFGYLATVLPEVCRVYIAADDAGVLLAKQKHIAAACRDLYDSLADVAIIALVDEATGHQRKRSRVALEEFLAMYLNKRLAAWERRFPESFYRHVYRLKGWEYNPNSTSRIPTVGRLTNDLVYSRLAPFVLDEMKKRTPKDEAGRRKHKFHQLLTKGIGIPELQAHFKALDAIFRGYEDGKFKAFYKHLNRALPPQPQEADLFSDFPFEEWEERV